MPFYPFTLFWGRVSLLKLTTEKVGTLIQTALLLDSQFGRKCVARSAQFAEALLLHANGRAGADLSRPCVCIG